MDIRLHNIILSNSVRIIITFHYCLVRYVATPTKFSFTVCLCRMRTICLKSRRRFATLSVDGKRADVLDLLWLVRRWKFDIGCLVDNIRSRLWSIGSLPSFGKGGGKSVLVVRAKFFFFSLKIEWWLSFWRESNGSSLSKRREKERKPTTILVSLGE